ncbi:glucose-6-phosphate dehydrogenase, partial [Cupriavidus basilensis]
MRPGVAGGRAAETWRSFAERILYPQVDANAPEGFDSLAELVRARRAPVVVFYLATGAAPVGADLHQLARTGLNHAGVRIVLEKPLGYDL